jgi:hypothetical protein
VSDIERGIYRKYEVRRVSDPTGKHDDCDYYVLDPTHDPFAIPAMRAYASACEAEYPQLAADLREWIAKATFALHGSSDPLAR